MLELNYRQVLLANARALNKTANSPVQESHHTVNELTKIKPVSEMGAATESVVCTRRRITKAKKCGRVFPDLLQNPFLDLRIPKPF